MKFSTNGSGDELFLLCWPILVSGNNSRPIQVALTVKKASDHTPYLQKVALGAQNHLQQKKWQQMNICLITAAAKLSTIIVGE